MKQNHTQYNPSEELDPTETTAEEKKPGIIHRIGDAIEHLGDKLEEKGYKKVGDAVEHFGDKIEHLGEKKKDTTQPSSLP